MATLKDYRSEQLDKLQKLQELGVNPYPSKSHRDSTIKSVEKDFAKLEGKDVTVAGRLLSYRAHGKLNFADIADSSGTVQLLLRAELLKPDYDNSVLGFEDLTLLSRGDFIEATGKVTKSKTGQVSVEVTSLRLLAKVLRPLPEKLEDKETRLRRRYLDLAINEDVRQRYLRRAKFWQATRDFLIKEGFVEINIPVLEHTTGGADAKPFVTHMDALDEDFYLRISHELPLKRLIGGGYEKVFDIGPRFRNENYSDEHLPEHVAMEFYWAYADWRKGMEFTKKLVQYVAKETFGTLKFKLDKFTIDLSGEWEEVEYSQIINTHYGIDVHNTDLKTVQKIMKSHGIESGKEDNLIRCIDKLWKELRKDIEGPVFLTKIPAFISPLAKTITGDEQNTESMQLVLAGTEVIKAYSELNDPELQLSNFKQQQKLREQGDEEAQMLDIDFVQMLEYGMPPTFGFGYSERLFWTLEDVTAREGVPFPQLRREIDDTTKEIYPDLFK